MTTQTEALKLALEALEDRVSLMKWQIARDAVKEALAQPEQTLKLMPREATPEMLKAMDECSMEGYDERLYAGHAGSVYMAAWDAFYGQHCYCGDITSLGVIHRNDGPCHYPEHKEPEQEPVARVVEHGATVKLEWANADAAHNAKVGNLYTTPPQRTWVGLTDEDKERCVGCEACIDTACGRDECPKGWPKAPQRTWVGLDHHDKKTFSSWLDHKSDDEVFSAIEAKLKELNT